MNIAYRELLELAALAGGIVHEGVEKKGLRLVKGGNTSWVKHWNPLTNDGDAFRLAVSLGIQYQIITMPHNVGVQAYDGTIEAVFESYGDDKYAATRRAIVRAAAAEIRKGVQCIK